MSTNTPMVDALQEETSSDASRDERRELYKLARTLEAASAVIASQTEAETRERCAQIAETASDLLQNSTFDGVAQAIRNLPPLTAQEPFEHNRRHDDKPLSQEEQDMLADAYHEANLPVPVPDGMVLVPREPTEAMLNETIKGMSFPQDFGADYQGKALREAVRIYRAMLYAAPSATVSDDVRRDAEFGQPRRYLTDDRDSRERHELIIMLGGNGDWYVSVLPEGDRIGPTVRLCTSGGASSIAPGLTVAISQAYRALAAQVKP